MFYIIIVGLSEFVKVHFNKRRGILKKERNSNIELLRIFAMLMIIAYHIFIHCVNGQLNTKSFNTPYIYKKLLILVTIAPMGTIGNVIFMIISGFFMVEKVTNIDISKISKKLLLQQGFAAIFLTVVSTVIFKLNTNDSSYFNLMDINIFNSMSWYIGYYFSIIMFAKLLLNNFLSKLNKSNYTRFLLGIFALIEFQWSSYTFLYSFSGGLLVFVTGVFLFSLGGYIKKYNPFANIRTFGLLLILIVELILINISFYNITENNLQNYYANGGTGTFTQSIRVYDNNSIIPIISGIVIFELFRRINIHSSKIINFLGSSTLMVYLAHDVGLIHSIWNTQDWITLLYYSPIKYMGKHALWTILTFVSGVMVHVLYLILMKFFKKISWIFIKKSSEVPNDTQLT